LLPVAAYDAPRITCICHIDSSFVNQSHICSTSRSFFSDFFICLLCFDIFSGDHHCSKFIFSFVCLHHFIDFKKCFLQSSFKILSFISLVCFKLNWEMLSCKFSSFKSTMSIKNTKKLSIYIEIVITVMSIFHVCSPPLHATCYVFHRDSVVSVAGWSSFMLFSFLRFLHVNTTFTHCWLSEEILYFY